MLTRATAFPYKLALIGRTERAQSEQTERHTCRARMRLTLEPAGQIGASFSRLGKQPSFPLLLLESEHASVQQANGIVTCNCG